MGMNPVAPVIGASPTTVKPRTHTLVPVGKPARGHHAKVYMGPSMPYTEKKKLASGI